MARTMEEDNYDIEGLKVRNEERKKERKNPIQLCEMVNPLLS